jgi:hypothetical protein
VYTSCDLVSKMEILVEHPARFPPGS